MPDFNILDYGALGNGTTNDAAAIQKTIDACGESGGGRVLVPSARVFKCGPIKLASRVELHLEAGSQLAAIPDIRLYPEFGLPSLGGEGQKWIHADSADFVSITGPGIIDGCGVQWMSGEEKYHFNMHAGRPFVLNMENCRHVTLKDFTIRDAPFWTVHMLGCDDVLAQNLRILNNLKIGNNDGINPNRCRNVRIIGCHIEAADDCICLKSEEASDEARYGACENIIVQGCTLVSTSCAIKVGTGTFGAIRNLIVDSCIISRSNRGIGLVMRDGGCISDMLFSNIIVETRLFHPYWWGAGEPIYVTALRRKEGLPAGTIRNIRFSNIACRSENGVYIAAEDPRDINNLTFSNVSVELTKHTRHPGSFFDRRPCAIPGRHEHPTSGFFISNASKISLRNCAVRWGANPPEYYRHALEAENAPGLTMEGLEGISAFPDKYEPVLVHK